MNNSIINEIISMNPINENPEVTIDNKFNILELGINPHSQKYILATIFHIHKGRPLTKREIEKEYSLRVSMKDIKFPATFENIESLLEKCQQIPGDVQRDLRLFHDKYTRYGLEKSGERTNTTYCWNPINKKELEPICKRNIFTLDERENFIKNKHHKCELCGKCDIRSNEEGDVMAIDHWRAHKTYKIDSPNIAVLLCQKCNNIHHDNDASKIALKYKENTSIVDNWLNIEKRICDKGPFYYPNEQDRTEQIKNIETIVNYHQQNGRPYPSILNYINVIKNRIKK